jgi:hypothetical protein
MVNATPVPRAHYKRRGAHPTILIWLGQDAPGTKEAAVPVTSDQQVLEWLAEAERFDVRR